jgi:hypothetical protein
MCNITTEKNFNLIVGKYVRQEKQPKIVNLKFILHFLAISVFRPYYLPMSKSKPIRNIVFSFSSQKDEIELEES